MGKAYFQLIEDRRLAEQRSRIARQREARLAAPIIVPAKEFKTEPMKTTASEWMRDVRRCIADINSRSFTLTEVYEYMDELEDLHPKALVDAKAAVRHTLQKLRDCEPSEVSFDSPGSYTDLLYEQRGLTAI